MIHLAPLLHKQCRQFFFFTPNTAPFSAGSVAAVQNYSLAAVPQVGNMTHRVLVPILPPVTALLALLWPDASAAGTPARKTVRGLAH